MDLHELEAMTADEDELRLDSPEVEQLLEQAGVDAIPDSATRATILAAMKKAAESLRA